MSTSICWPFQGPREGPTLELVPTPRVARQKGHQGHTRPGRLDLQLCTAKVAPSAPFPLLEPQQKDSQKRHTCQDRQQGNAPRLETGKAAGVRGDPPSQLMCTPSPLEMWECGSMGGRAVLFPQSLPLPRSRKAKGNNCFSGSESHQFHF